ncbi:hypothetical protein J2853_009585 [Streptosporangium lutulentum]|uniref:Uncharacterized protein n=1 Tax=Streptosporangium lutulentum TaxID=1461250 RepID=A0ABT9QU67_9ACTN|nr:hypothetical protein [Streptosporangium lutulentum]
MRDRRPPSDLWDCGTRAANISRQRAILMAFNTPFTLCWRYFLDLMHHLRTAAAPSTAGTLQLLLVLTRPTVVLVTRSLLGCCCCGSASTARTLQPLGPGTSDLLPVHFLPQLLVHGRGPSATAGPGASDVVSRSLLLLWQRVHGRDPSTARSWHVRPSAPLHFHCVVFVIQLSTLVRAVRRDAYVLLCPRGSVPCDVRNSTPTRHGCLLQPLQIFGTGDVKG